MTPKKPSRRGAMIGGALLLVIAVSAGALYHFVSTRPEPIDLAAMIPSDARFFIEYDASHFDESRQKTFNEIAAYLKAKGDFEEEPPDLSRLGSRFAIAIYGSAQLQGVVPGVVAVALVNDPAAFEPVFDRFMKKANIADASESEDGWAVRKGEKSLLMGVGKLSIFIARKENIRVVTTSRQLLTQVIALAAKKDRNSLAVSSRFLAAFGKEGPPPEPGFVERTKAAFSDPPVPPLRRSFLDLEGIVDDFHPLLSMFGGNAYKQMKQRYLDSLRSYATTGEAAGQGYSEISKLALSDEAKWVSEWAKIETHWPAVEPDDAWLSYAQALPEGWTEGNEELLEEAIHRAGTAQLSKLQHDIGRVNGAIAMYFADHKGTYPVAKSPIAIGEIDLTWEENSSSPDTAWGGSYMYTGTKAGYTVYAEIEGESIVWYNSMNGAIEMAEDAAERIAETRFTPEEILPTLDKIRELALCVRPKADNELFPPAFLMLRAENDESAAELEELASGFVPPGMDAIFSVTREGTWLIAGGAAGLSDIVELLAGAKGESSLFGLAIQLPMREISGDKAAPEITWNVSMKGKAEPGALSMTLTANPDFHPAIYAAILSGSFMKEPNLPGQQDEP